MSQRKFNGYVYLAAVLLLSAMVVCGSYGTYKANSRIYVGLDAPTDSSGIPGPPDSAHVFVHYGKTLVYTARMAPVVFNSWIDSTARWGNIEYYFTDTIPTLGYTAGHEGTYHIKVIGFYKKLPYVMADNTFDVYGIDSTGLSFAAESHKANRIINDSLTSALDSVPVYATSIINPIKTLPLMGDTTLVQAMRSAMKAYKFLRDSTMGPGDSVNAYMGPLIAFFTQAGMVDNDTSLVEFLRAGIFNGTIAIDSNMIYRQLGRIVKDSTLAHLTTAQRDSILTALSNAAMQGKIWGALIANLVASNSVGNMFRAIFNDSSGTRFKMFLSGIDLLATGNNSAYRAEASGTGATEDIRNSGATQGHAVSIFSQSGQAIKERAVGANPTHGVYAGGTGDAQHWEIESAATGTGKVWAVLNESTANGYGAFFRSFASRALWYMAQNYNGSNVDADVFHLESGANNNSGNVIELYAGGADTSKHNYTMYAEGPWMIHTRDGRLWENALEVYANFWGRPISIWSSHSPMRIETSDADSVGLTIPDGFTGQTLTAGALDSLLKGIGNASVAAKVWTAAQAVALRDTLNHALDSLKSLRVQFHAYELRAGFGKYSSSVTHCNNDYDTTFYFDANVLKGRIVARHLGGTPCAVPDTAWVVEP